MRLMRTNNGTNIKNVLKTHPRNAVLTAKELLRLEVSRETQRSFVRSGWLRRIGMGAYILLDEQVELAGAIYALQSEPRSSIHEGAYSALAGIHGKAHNLVEGRKPQLFCMRGERIPAWFSSCFGSRCELFFTSFLPVGIGLVNHGQGTLKVNVSSPERAIMEMLYLSPQLFTLQETYQIMELLTVAKPMVVQALLEGCSSIKVKRLFLYMAELAGHAWLKRLDLSKVNLGSGVREIVKGGSLNSKYNIVVNDLKAK